MDISLIKDNSIKIKGNKTAIVTDPVSKTEAQIVVLTGTTETLDMEKVEGIKLVIEGPGEYEVGGVSITGKNVKGDLTFDIIDSSRILLTPSTGLSKIQNEDEYDAMLIKVVDPISEDKFTSLNAKVFILYGNLALLNLKSENIEKTNRVNLKKTEAYGKIVLLTTE